MVGFVLFWDEGLSRFGGKDDMYVELRVGIWNRGGNFRWALNLPLRWSGKCYQLFSTKHVTPQE